MPFFPILAQRLSQWPARALYPISFILGASLATLAMAPHHQFLLFFLITPLIVWIMQTRQTFRFCFLIGFFFGWGYFSFGLYWIANAFLVSPAPWLGPFAVIALAALLGTSWGIAFGAAQYFFGQPYRDILSLTFFWSLAFWIQSFFATGFPWNLPAQSWVDSLALAQHLSWTGIYGATFLMILISVSLSSLSSKNIKTALLPSSLASLLFLFLWVSGATRLSQITTENTSTHIHIIQPNIAQKDKWNPAKRDAIIQTYLSMTATAIATSPPPTQQQPAIIVWPEAALPINITRSPQLRKTLANIMPEHSWLFAGLIRFHQQQVFNSLFVLNHQGEIIHIYDKNHLVPFGEYLPFYNLLKIFGLRQIVETISGARNAGIASGQNREWISPAPPHLPPALPLICFEILFPREISREIAYPNTAPPSSSHWIVNVTNDGWYGNSAGPHQHLDIARLRAIEFGIPVIRAANTGISAIIHPNGSIQKKQPLETKGILSAPLPQSLPPTFYAIYREWVFILFLCLTVALLLWLTHRQDN